MSARLVLVLACLLPAAGAACTQERELPGHAPGGGGTGQRPPVRGSPDEDAGAEPDAESADAGPDASADAGSDAAADGAVSPLDDGCFELDASASSSNIESPLDFRPTRAYARLDQACEVLQVGLSTGRCPGGSGHELAFELDREPLENGTLGPGFNLVEPEPGFNGIRVRYTRPTQEPIGEWGNCAGAGGSLDVVSLGLQAGSTLRFGFSLDLTDCAAQPSQPAQRVVGNVAVLLRAGPSEACP